MTLAEARELVHEKRLNVLEMAIAWTDGDVESSKDIRQAVKEYRWALEKLDLALHEGAEL